MTKKILIDETVVKQALEALEKPAFTHAAALQNLSEALELVLRWIDDWCETGPETGFDLIEEKANAALEVNNKGVNALAEQAAQQQNGPINEGWQITVAHGHSGYGVYAHMEDYPEEGAVLVQAIEQPAQQAAGSVVGWVLLREDADGFEPIMFYGGKEKPEGEFKDRFTLRPVRFADATQQDGTNGVVALQPLTKWEPIETAPKDGTEVLVFSPDVDHMVSFYYAGLWREKANMLGMRKEPTHWMPLPDAPTTHGTNTTNQGE